MEIYISRMFLYIKRIFCLLGKNEKYNKFIILFTRRGLKRLYFTILFYKSYWDMDLHIACVGHMGEIDVGNLQSHDFFS